jgi:hypothetical protein
VRGGAEDADPAGGVLDDRQDVHAGDGGWGDLDTQDEEFAVDAPESQELLSRARRRTNARMDRTVRGRPTRFGREILA